MPHSRTLIVSVHDVHQHNTEAVSRILCQLQRAGVSKCSLLVVPNYNSQGPLSDDTDFCSWLYTLERRGYEIVAHGFTHKHRPAPKTSPRDWVMTRVYTRGEGEFYDLSEFEAEEKLRQARATFRNAGVSARGFIAPAWLMSAGAQRAARRLGFEYTTRLSTVTDLENGRTTRARSFVYSTSSSWRRATSLVWNGFLKTALTNAAVQRIGIHPPDAMHPAIWKQELDIIQKSASQRRVATYLEWILASRQQPA